MGELSLTEASLVHLGRGLVSIDSVLFAFEIVNGSIPLIEAF